MNKQTIKKIIPHSWLVFYRRLKEKKKIKYMRKVPGVIISDKFRTWSEEEKIVDGVQYYSQFKQDMFIDTMVFFQKRDGVFLDIGANDPIKINNTYFFEKERNWTGIAFEPQPEVSGRWVGVRKTECKSIALGSEEKTVEYVQRNCDTGSGIRGVVGEDSTKEIYKVQMRPLKNVLEEANISRVDYMSLDVEGYEMEVLKGIDFDKVDIHCVSLENNKGSEGRLRKFFVSKGYTLRALIGCDEIWVKEHYSD